tara:strand:+ start:1629 stop:2306 length:678 start_codon:yes stop_codon:yes gene_type:complete
MIRAFFNVINFYLLLNIVLANQTLHYNIKYLGFNAADCHISIKDTVYHSYGQVIKVNFVVETKNFFDLIYPIKNTYSIILDELDNIIYFSKKTSQPGLSNIVETELVNNNVLYKNTNFYIKEGHYNIFSLLYQIMLRKNIPENIDIEREGMIYKGVVKKNINEYDIYLNIDENNNIGIFENTDIFTWALFKNNSKRKIIVNDNIDRIEKCIFKLGLTSMTASFVE